MIARRKQYDETPTVYDIRKSWAEEHAAISSILITRANGTSFEVVGNNTALSRGEVVIRTLIVSVKNPHARRVSYQPAHLIEREVRRALDTLIATELLCASAHYGIINPSED
jgi:hypothetical protein